MAEGTGTRSAVRRDFETAAGVPAVLVRRLQPKEEPKNIPAPDRLQRAQALRTYLGQVRHHLNGPSQSFSKIVHNPTINSISETAGNTVVRPSGILTGSILTLVGSAYYLYATRQTGYHYRFIVATILFVGGFIVGLAIEALFRLFTKRPQTKP